MRFHKKSEVGEVDVRHNCPSKTVHLSMGSRKLLHLDWNIEYSDVHFSCIFSNKLKPTLLGESPDRRGRFFIQFVDAA